MANVVAETDPDNSLTIAMEYLPEIIRHLALEPRMLKLMNRDVKLPAYLDEYQNPMDHWYPHPPCLIPIFLGHGAAYQGVCHHFFCDRETSYVEYHLESGYLSEIARTFDQFLSRLVLQMIIIEDELTTRIKEICAALDFNDAEAVDQFALDYGDDPEAFSRLVHFDQRIPFKYLHDAGIYDGDFPSSLYILNPAKLACASIFEIAAEEQLSTISDLPSWLKPQVDRISEFDAYLAAGQLKEAWLTLNAKGWMLPDLAAALTQLSAKADNELLALVTANWISGWQRSLSTVQNTKL